MSNKIPEVVYHYFNHLNEHGYKVEIDQTQCYFILNDLMAKVKIREESLDEFLQTIEFVYDVQFEPYNMTQWWEEKPIEVGQVS